MLEDLKTRQPGLFDSRQNIPNQEFAAGDVAAFCPQEPARGRWYDLDLKQLRDQCRVPPVDLVRYYRDNLQKEVEKPVSDSKSQGGRFLEAAAVSAMSAVVKGIRELVLNSSEALPTPHVLFERLLLQGAVRLPSEELIPLNELLNCRDAKTLLEAGKYIWRYCGFEGIAGDRGYADLENPPDATLAEYHGNPSRAGFNVKSRVAWSDEFQTALVTKTPIAMSNMEALADLEAARKSIAAGVMATLFSGLREERLKAAEELKHNILITVRTSDSEIALAKELLDLGSNVHIELANAHSHIGLETVMILKDHIRAKNYDRPRFVTIGKSVGGAFFISAVLAGADGVFVNRGSSMICSTPTVTGSGIRTWSAVYETALAQRLTFLLTGRDVPYWADAGVNSGADILKAMVAGAEGSMVGTALIRTIESPSKKILVELPDGTSEWRTESWGDASNKGQRHKEREGVAAQGVSTTLSIPRRPDGEPVKIADVASKMVLEIRAGGADAFVESVSELPYNQYANDVRFPGAGARLELQAKEVLLPGKPLREIAARVGED
jgi:thiazole synthase ThiGH ThiG subunit